MAAVLYGGAAGRAGRFVHDFTPGAGGTGANPCFKPWKSGAGSVYCNHDHRPGPKNMGWLDYYLIILFLALIGLLVVKFRG
jgi:hypothetical protein